MSSHLGVHIVTTKSVSKISCQLLFNFRLQLANTHCPLSFVQTQHFYFYNFQKNKILLLIEKNVFLFEVIMSDYLFSINKLKIIVNNTHFLTLI